MGQGVPLLPSPSDRAVTLGLMGWSGRAARGGPVTASLTASSRAARAARAPPGACRPLQTLPRSGLLPARRRFAAGDFCCFREDSGRYLTCRGRRVPPTLPGPRRDGLACRRGGGDGPTGPGRGTRDRAGRRRPPRLPPPRLQHNTARRAAQLSVVSVEPPERAVPPCRS